MATYLKRVLHEKQYILPSFRPMLPGVRMRGNFRVTNGKFVSATVGNVSVGALKK